MSEDLDIEITPAEEDVPKLERRVGFKALGLGVILASLFGAGGGTLLSQTMQEPAVDVSPLTANIETLQSENKNLKAQLARLQKDIKTLPKPKSVNLKAIQSRLAALENAESQEIDPDLVSRLEALKEEGSEALDLSDILARLDALENRPVAISPTTNAALVLSDVSSVKPFPEAVVLTALESAQPSGGWLKRSLKKHISVQSDDNPHYLVELIVENIEDGNIEAALTAFDKLPAEAKAAGQAWRDSLTN